MTTDTKEKVRAKIIAEVPEIAWKKCRVCNHKHPQSKKGYCGYIGCQAFMRDCEKGERPITLADVLKTLEFNGCVNWSIAVDGTFWNHLVVHKNLWNLTLSLDEQEDAVWEFLGKVLGIEEK